MSEAFIDRLLSLNGSISMENAEGSIAVAQTADRSMSQLALGAMVAVAVPINTRRGSATQVATWTAITLSTNSINFCLGTTASDTSVAN
jgi:hypothetical protein